MTPRERAEKIAKEYRAADDGDRVEGWFNDVSGDIEQAINDAVAAEREAIAVMVEGLKVRKSRYTDNGKSWALFQEIGEVIRERGQM